MGVLCGESDCGEYVHNQVDPEELDHVEGRVTKDEGGGDNEEKAREIGSHLKGHKLSNIVLKITTPPDGGNDCQEVVIRKDNISVVLGGCAAVLTHGEADVSLTNCSSVGETFTSNSDDSL